MNIASAEMSARPEVYMTGAQHLNKSTAKTYGSAFGAVFRNLMLVFTLVVLPANPGWANCLYYTIRTLAEPTSGNEAVIASETCNFGFLTRQGTYAVKLKIAGQPEKGAPVFETDSQAFEVRWVDDHTLSITISAMRTPKISLSRYDEIEVHYDLSDGLRKFLNPVEFTADLETLQRNMRLNQSSEYVEAWAQDRKAQYETFKTWVSSHQ